jgi:hypothetical protein
MNAKQKKAFAAIEQLSEAELGTVLREYTDEHACVWGWPLREWKGSLALLEEYLVSLNDRNGSRNALIEGALARQKAANGRQKRKAA